jgi:predicted metalloprotease with PDZ domain
LLWLFEGFTSYYDDLQLFRSKRITLEQYLQLVSNNWNSVLRGPGRLKQSLADSSFDAWTKYYQADENTPNAVVSYYGKGALLALGLDLQIRAFSKTRNHWMI